MQSLSPAISTPSRQSSKPATSTLDHTVDKLTQTIALLSANDPDGFYDIAQRDKLYSQVDAQEGAVLLEKVERAREEAAQHKAREASIASGEQAEASAVGGLPGSGTATPTLSEAPSKSSKVSDRFGSVVRGLRRVGEGEK